MKKLEPREELEKKLKHHQRWYVINRVFRDYSHAISLIISISIPTCLLVLPSLPPDRQQFLNNILLFVTLIGLILSLVRTVFKFEEKTIHNKTLLDKINDIARRFDKGFLNSEKLIDKLADIETEERKEAER